jgi:hypothetical protein
MRYVIHMEADSALAAEICQVIRRMDGCQRIEHESDERGAGKICNNL